MNYRDASNTGIHKKRMITFRMENNFISPPPLLPLYLKVGSTFK